MASQTISQPAAVKSSRLVSIDVLRGITIAFMILVNNNGQHAYWTFEHAQWNGWTPTDLVFPTFLFLSGVSIVFSAEARLGRGQSKGTILSHDIRRSIILFALGLVVNSFPFFNFSTMRIYGVLQRIAICFLVGSILYLFDRARVWTKVALLVFCLVTYWALMRFVPVPGYGLPGRDVPLLDTDGNLVAYIDRSLLPAKRLYEHVRDPEGLLSTLPALGTMLLGQLTAIWLRTTRSLQQKCLGLLAGGVAGVVLGELWNPWFPINKKLWTSSYVLFAAGCSLLGLTLCFWLAEIRGWKKGWTFPWLVFGMNSIAAYMISELLGAAMYTIPAGPHKIVNQVIYEHIYAPIRPLGVGALCYAISFVFVCWLAALVLYKKKIFLKV
jgi:predicted acyltransferase